MARMGVQHVRSASVPWQTTHPVVTDVEVQLVALRSWTSNPGSNPLSLAHVRALLCVLDELLHLPLAKRALAGADGLLDGFLVLADAFGTFLAALLALRQHAADLRAAVRRRDAAKLASAARAQRQVGRELEHLAAAVVREAARCAKASLLASAASPAVVEVEVARAVAEAVNDTGAASASVFSAVGAVADAAAALASPASSSPKKRLPPLVNASSSSRSSSNKIRDSENREATALAKLHELEQCVGELESESEKVFRSLVQTRVSLLNIHTPTF
ncbi:unnamed protein product [Urochloa humidicola]